MKFSGIIALLVVFAASTWADDTDVDMFGVLNILYLRADMNMDEIITENELENMFTSMDKNNDSRITQGEFTDLWSPLTGQSSEMSHAYFMLWDINGDGELDAADDVEMYKIFDIDGNGKVEAIEFSKTFQRTYHRVPFVVLFDRETNLTDGQPGHLTKEQFGTFFSSFTTQFDGSVTLYDFKTSWVQDKFGRAIDAETIFASLDTDRNDFVSTGEVIAKFDGLDKDGNGTLELREVYTLGDVIQPS